jgi:hypothetical protein
MINPNQIPESDLERFHQAAKIIEIDAEQGYLTCRDRFGYEIATALLVAFYRREFGSMDGYPPRDEVIDKTNELLKEHKMIRPSCPTCGG